MSQIIGTFSKADSPLKSGKLNRPSADKMPNTANKTFSITAIMPA